MTLVWSHLPFWFHTSPSTIVVSARNSKLLVLFASTGLAPFSSLSSVNVRSSIVMCCPFLLSPKVHRCVCGEGGGAGLHLGRGGGRRGGVLRGEGATPPCLSLRTNIYHSRFFFFSCRGFVVKADGSFPEGCC